VAYQGCHFSEGLNLFALQIGLDFGFAKKALHPRAFEKARPKLLVFGDVAVSTIKKPLEEFL